ncbi:hypothetical protein [Pseudohongiella nitratireducens]|uniref:hypothetical protein n=1 Tax=Pseudohongiella nitratireducens TaxID=1768907 RepID=UPI0030EF4E6D|tara:strand:+ start:3007 stop:3657 length:651 start_codon:yes stop_codon:yes gene_type:complete
MWLPSPSNNPIGKKALLLLMMVTVLTRGSSAHAHGSVVDGGDGCTIQLDFYSAHFSIYQPDRSGHRAYCEDIPVATDTLFVMEYQHNAMREVPIEFRIIRNDSPLGRFVRWSDIQQIEDIDAVTAYYQSAQPRPDGVLSIQHVFQAEGDYVGIVSAPHPDGSPTYHAVFPFHVGRPLVPVWGWPILGIGILLLWWRYRKHTQPASAMSGNQPHETM